MFPIEFYSFDKRENSTARPVGAGTVLDGVLHWGFSVLNPLIDINTTENPTKYNYMFIREFKEQGASEVPGRFYFIENWSYDKGIWTAHGSVDALASWRDEIGELPQYVVRSAQRANPFVVDMLYPATSKISEGFEGLTNIWGYNMESGSYIIGIIAGSGLDRVGATNYYIMNQAQMIVLLNVLMDEPTWTDLPNIAIREIKGAILGDDVNLEISDSNFLTTLKTEFNPIQYIVSCQWFPFDLTEKLTEITRAIPLGWWTLPDSVSGFLLKQKNAIKWISKYIKIPRHPQMTEGSRNYLTLEPFSRYSFFGGPFGVIPLDSTKIRNTTHMSMDIAVDLITGIGTLYLGQASESIQGAFYCTTCQFGVPIQLAQMANNIYKAAATAVTGAVSAIESTLRGSVSGAIASITTGIGNALQAAVPQLISNGANGSTSGFLLQPGIHAWFFNVVDEDVEHRGRPLCEIHKPSFLGGYMQVADADVHLPATKQEISIIKNYMEGGFYWQ